MKEHIIIGSRGSDLALWQAHYTKSELETKCNCTAEIKIIKTQGDMIQNVSFDKMEGKGFFTKEIEEALLNKEIDIAVHSHKDLPTTNPEGLEVAAVSYRENPAELLLIRQESFDRTQTFFLKPDAVVGTSSGRRISQMGALRPDFEFKVLRGNVPTRINKLREGQYDAIVLAAAGIRRLKLNLDDLVNYELYPENIIPAPAQGVLAFQVHTENTRVKSILKALHNKEVADLISVERDLLRRFDGGCQLALGAYTFKTENGVQLNACWSPDRKSAPLYLRLRNQSIDTLSENAYTLFQHAEAHLKKKKVYLTKSAKESVKLVETSRAFAIETMFQPHITIKPIDFKHQKLHTDYAVFTSKNGVESFFDQGNTLAERTKILCVGKMTAKSLIAHGYEAHFIPNEQSQQGIIDWISQNDPKRHYTFIAGNKALHGLENSVEKLERIEVYETIENKLSGAQISFLERATDIVFTSPSNVRPCKDLEINWATKNIFAFGKTTEDAVKEHLGTDPLTLIEPSADELISMLIQH